MNALHVIPLHRRSRADSASARAPVKLRLRVYATRGALDRQIASGRPFLSTPALALRAQQLTEPRTRRRVARALRRIVDYADQHTGGRVFSAVVVEPTAVKRARHPLLGLAERLESAARLHPAGVARAQVLITDGLSPLFYRDCPRTVTQAIYEVQDALEDQLADVVGDAASS